MNHSTEPFRKESNKHKNDCNNSIQNHSIVGHSKFHYYKVEDVFMCIVRAIDLDPLRMGQIIKNQIRS